MDFGFEKIFEGICESMINNDKKTDRFPMQWKIPLILY